MSKIVIAVVHERMLAVVMNGAFEGHNRALSGFEEHLSLQNRYR